MKAKNTIILIAIILGFALKAVSDNYADSLYQVIHSEKSDLERMHAMALLAGDILPSDMDSVYVLLDLSAALANLYDHPVERAAWLNIAGNYNWYAGNRDSAMVNYHIVYALDADDILNRRAAAAINLASLYQSAGEIDSARYFYDSAISIFTELGDEAGLAHANYSLGVFYNRRNNYELALRHIRSALEYREQEGDPFHLMHTYVLMGNIYLGLERADKALEYYKKTLELAEENPNHPMVSTLYNNFVSYYTNHAPDHDLARQYAEKGIQVAVETNRKDILFTLYSNLGILYTDKGMYEDAIEWFGKANEFEEVVTPELIAASRFNQGRLYRKLNQYQKARNFLQEAIDYATTSGSRKWLSYAHNQLFLIDSITGNHFQAIAHLQESVRQRDSIWQKERMDRINELEIIYETEKKEAENRLLRESNILKEQVIRNQKTLVILSISASLLLMLFLVSIWISRRRIQSQKMELELLHQNILDKQMEITAKNDLLNQKNRELEELVATKDKFFSIISHDLKGPFNSLLGFLNILAEDKGSLDDEKKNMIIRNLQQISKRTFEMLANLLEWASIQRKRIVSNPEQTFVRSLIQECLVVLNYNIEKKEHEVINEVDHLLAVMVDPRLLRSILINLINNAVKFTYRGGEISISAKMDDDPGLLKICVSDNGMGIPADKIDTLFDLGTGYRQAGTEKESGTGLGLITIKELVDLMGGRIEVTSKPDEGSTFCIILPAERA